ncbi:MAG TPA: CehA/McbA family metallohydrolase [Lacipirellulaceae bacterium]
MLGFYRIAVTLGLFHFAVGWVAAADMVQLDETNWSAYVPDGKEVDAIYGDYALRSDRLMAIVGRAVATRHANMTVKNVGGALVDFTRRDAQSDQLSCFYPHGTAYTLEGPADWPKELGATDEGWRIAFRAKPIEGSRAAQLEGLQIIVGYELSDGVDYLVVRSLITNTSEQPIEFELADEMRADGEFKSGLNPQLNLWWCYDEYWRQAYGVQPADERFVLYAGRPEGKGSSQLEYRPASGGQAHAIAPGKSLTFERRIFPAADSLGTQAIARRLRREQLVAAVIAVRDSSGPVADAMVRIKAGEVAVGAGRTKEDGKLVVEVPAGGYQCHVAALGRPEQAFEVRAAAGRNGWDFRLPDPGYLEATITDEAGSGIPCKVAFYGQGVADPNFGPDSAVHGVRNLWYTHEGRVRVELLPGRYEVVISHGPEYDAIIRSVDVAAGETARLSERLRRSVDTSGWLSADLHSHSTPSGDNTASQRGRVLNLLAEHLEFIPCTEHQRLSTYEPHLKHFGANHRVLTCTGMELTGQPLPINHQNAFPLILRERTQDGGAPQIDAHPEVQIERLAMWDDASDKVVQINHPNIAQMIGDRDLDGRPDQGFRKMFHYADVIEVHPPQMIFADLSVGEGGPRDRGNAIVNWMQLLNLGYRVPGVVNTDAHWNFHGSGWIRNYIRSSTDNPAEADLMEICHALEKGRVVMTNGPFMTVIAASGETSVEPGDDLTAVDGEVQLRVRVACPNWIDVNRVQVFINGRPVEEHNYTRRTHGQMFGNGAVKFDNALSVALNQDAHVIVATGGDEGQLARVYGPDRASAVPTAVSNPIFCDVDGGGFTPNRDMLGLALPVEPGHRPTHGHDHQPPQ